MALFVASNLSDTEGLDRAFQAVNAIRHSPDVNPFDVCRADVIYFASRGFRDDALKGSIRLAEASRVVPDVQLACKGMRNAADVCSYYGDRATAQALLHEARILASDLEYFTQAAWTDLRLADLCIETMDADGASAYIQSAAEISDKNRILSPLLAADINLFTCWEALLRGDHARAQKAARVVGRRLHGAQLGTALWTLVSVKLATHRGAYSKEVRKETAILRESIGSRPFHPNEKYSLAALLLSTKSTPFHAEMSTFVESQFPRIVSYGQEIWPMITMNLADKS